MHAILKCLIVPDVTVSQKMLDHERKIRKHREECRAYIAAVFNQPQPIKSQSIYSAFSIL